MSYDIITIDEINRSIAKKNYFNGYYIVEFNSGLVYKGKLVNSKPHGYGIMADRKKNNKKLYDGIWVKGNPIDNISLPTINVNNAINLDVTNTCQKLNFTYKNINKKSKAVEEEFNLEYYVPFVSSYDLNAVKAKAISQKELSIDDLEIDVEVNATQCDIKTVENCLALANDIDNLAYYITQLDEECSNCQRFNRGWLCCGQFAPYLYIYTTLLYGNEYKNFIANYNFNKDKKDRKPSYINDLASVFYKVFTGYGLDNKEYHDIIDKIKDEYLVEIPNVEDDESFWYKPSEVSYNTTHFENNKSYLINIIDGSNIYHYSFIHRCNDYIIICDSWSSEHGKRFPVTRIIHIDVFLNCLNKLNNIYNNKDIYDKNNLSDREQQNKDMLLYNFIMDTLFLVPYYNENISNSNQAFNIDSISELRIVDLNVINDVFKLLDEEEGKPFEEYLMMGGARKVNKISIKKKKTRRKVNKSKSKKKNKVKEKYLMRK